MTLVSSANIMDSNEQFRCRGRSLMYILTVKALQLNLGELNVLL